MAQKRGSAVRSIEEVRTEFAKTGTSISAWARENGVQARTVFYVLNSGGKAYRGEAHKVAVLLGIKRGEIVHRAAA
jgi:gp16 family phage-associated protein